MMILKKQLFPLLIVLSCLTGGPLWCQQQLPTFTELSSTPTTSTFSRIFGTPVKYDEIIELESKVRADSKNTHIREGMKVYKSLFPENGDSFIENVIYTGNLGADTPTSISYPYVIMKKVGSGSQQASSSSTTGEQNQNDPKPRKVNVNTGSLEEFISLLGLDYYRANALINYRTNNGKFDNPYEIHNVFGFTDQLTQILLPQIEI